MFSITDEMIEELASSYQVFQRGLQYFQKNKVIDLVFNRENLCVTATVYGSEPYNVEVCFSKKGNVKDLFCDCPAYYRYEAACKHIVAVLKALQQKLGNGALKNKSHKNGDNNRLAESILSYFDYGFSKPELRPVDLEINLEINAKNTAVGRKIVHALTLRVGEEKLYVIKSAKVFFETIMQRQSFVFGKKFTFDPHSHTFRPHDKSVIELISDMYEVEQNMAESSWHLRHNSQSGLFQGKQIILTHSAVKRLLSLLQSEMFNVVLFDREYKNVEIIDQDLPLEFALDKKNDRLVLQSKQQTPFPLEQSGTYFFWAGRIHRISERQREFYLPFFSAFTENPAGISFAEQQQQRFVSQILPVVKQIGQVEVSPAVKSSLYEAELEVKIYLDRAGETVTANVEFVYGDIKINPFAVDNQYNPEGRILVRDVKGEQAVLNLFEKTEFKNANGQLYLDREGDIYDFIAHILPEVHQLAEVYYSDAFRNIRVRSSTAFSGGVRLNGDGSMLDFSFTLQDIDTSELPGVFQSLREKKRYHRLKDGSFLALNSPGSPLEQVMHMLDAFDIPERDLDKKIINLPKYRALYIDRCLKEANVRVERNLAFKQLVQNITEPQDMEFEVPVSFQGVLRGYQKTGFKWLKTLALYGLGGILADDMGLGKTIQTLAFIVSEKERVQEPALVIAPTSVIYNWQAEAERFAPGLKVVVVTGTPQERGDLLKEAKQSDVVITSYALLRRDVEFYRDFNFSCCFLDEAQHIKNPGALSSKAVKTIMAREYFALTGTPLENSLTELWSVFDFVMRGYLLSRQKFAGKYGRPIMKDQDERALRELQKQIAPFILRRMKRDVLQELPPKIESRVLIDLTREQKKIYLAYLKKAQGEFEKAIATSGFERSQIKILALLTRLRQICCHPAVFLDNYQGDSGKLEYLRETVKDAISGGHRILLFSQFTGVLEIIRQYLDIERISYFYLDGATKTEERGRLVRDFNGGEGDVFLISLKAGGTGLNLTGADMVIHYDPWWNPAVEEQATDRAYRIGQKNPVQVIKLITKGTIEEKIYELQQKKKVMIDSVIKPGETFLTRFTEQELKDLLWGQT
jgi:ERCC4-related helicase